MTPTASERAHGCPCGSGRPYNGCCGPYHAGRRIPATAEETMRARYCAYATHHEGFLLLSWYLGNRPARVHFDPHLRWTGLDVLATTGGVPPEREGTVEFVAHYEEQRRGQWVAGQMHELSRFVHADDRWVYVEGIVGRDI